MPDAQSNRIKPTVFNVLLLDIAQTDVSSILTYTEMLHDYLDRLGLTNNRIRMHVAVSSSTMFLNTLAQMNDFFFVHEIEVDSKDAILQLADTQDIDILLDEVERFTKQEIHQSREKIAIVHWYKPQFTDLLNAICTGWGVVWNFREPVFNGHWITKYLEPNSLARNVFDFMATGQNQGYNPEQVNFIRSMSNKISQLNHSRQLLDYTLLLHRHANRHELPTNDLLFEHSYHLNNYYILMSSTLDVFSRLINSVYSLGFRQFAPYTLDKTTFLDALALKRKTLSDIIRLKKHLDWMDWLRQRRNLFAHQSHIGLTEVIRRKRIQLTEQELDQKVEDSMDWAYMATAGIGNDVITQMKSMNRFQIDLEENYEKVVSDIMTLEKQERISGDVRQVIYFPLRAIEDDYKLFDGLVNRLIKNLTGARRLG